MDHAVLNGRVLSCDVKWGNEARCPSRAVKSSRDGQQNAPRPVVVSRGGADRRVYGGRGSERAGGGTDTGGGARLWPALTVTRRTSGHWTRTSCASCRGRRGPRRRVAGRTASLSGWPSASEGGSWSVAALSGSSGLGLRGKKRRLKRRLLGA